MLVMILTESIHHTPIERIMCPTEPEIEDVIKFSDKYNPSIGYRSLTVGDYFYYSDAPSTWYRIEENLEVSEEGALIQFFN